MTHRYRVTGMTCGGCEAAVKRAIERMIPGVTARAAHADEAVVVDGPHEPDQVRQAVEKAGFQFVNG